MFAVENVWSRDINSIDSLLVEPLFQIVVFIGPYVVPLTQLAILFWISSDKRYQLGVFRMFKRRQYGCLRDVFQSNNA